MFKAVLLGQWHSLSDPEPGWRKTTPLSELLELINRQLAEKKPKSRESIRRRH